MNVQTLDPDHLQQVGDFLWADPYANLFALTLTTPIMFTWRLWVGVFEDDKLVGVAFNWPGKYTLPVAGSDPVREMLRIALSEVDVGMVVGSRETCDAIMKGRVTAPGARAFDHQMMICTQVNDQVECLEVETASWEYTHEIAHHAAMMTIEDLGLDPRVDGYQDYLLHIRQRIDAGHTWILKEDYDVVFQVHMGYAMAHAAQVGGTWVAPNRRGRGLSVGGMASVCKTLLQSVPCIVLEVNEKNTPAVKAYERVGFRLHVPMRFWIPRDDTHNVAWTERIGSGE